jgi:hypothetical protein
MVRGDRQREHRRIGRIGLAVDRRRGQDGGQQALRGVDGRLHLLLGDVDVQAEVELQHDDRGAAGAGGGHLAQPCISPNWRSSGAVTVVAITSGWRRDKT